MTASISDRQIGALNHIASALDRIATALHYGVVVAPPRDAPSTATSGPGSVPVGDGVAEGGDGAVVGAGEGE